MKVYHDFFGVSGSGSWPMRRIRNTDIINQNFVWPYLGIRNIYLTIFNSQLLKKLRILIKKFSFKLFYK